MGSRGYGGRFAGSWELERFAARSSWAAAAHPDFVVLEQTRSSRLPLKVVLLQSSWISRCSARSVCLSGGASACPVTYRVSTACQRRTRERNGEADR